MNIFLTIQLLIIQNSIAASCRVGDAACIDQKFKEVCGDVINEKGKPINENVPQEKVQYCVSAKQSKVVAIYNPVSAALFSAGAGVCFAACVYPYLSQACSGISTGLGIADGVASGIFSRNGQEMQSILQASTAISGATGIIGLIGVQQSGNVRFEKGVSTKDYVKADKAANQSKDIAKNNNAANEPTKGDAQGAAAMSCITGIMMTAQASLKVATAIKAQESRIKNIDLAQNYQSSPDNDVNYQNTNYNSNSSQNGNNTRTSSGGTVGSMSDVVTNWDQDQKTMGSCNSFLSGQSSSLGDCVKQDAATAGLLDGGLGEQFQQLTQMNLGDFVRDTLNQNQNPAASISGLMGGNLESQKAMAEVLSNVQGEHLSQESAKYLASNHSGSDGSSNGISDLQNQMSQTLAQLMNLGNEKPKEAQKSDESHWKRNLASQTNNEFGDPSISLFERVSKTYQNSKKNLMNLPWASTYNQATHHE